MNSLVIVLITFFGYLLAYRTYGKFLGSKLFKLGSNEKLPSHEFKDGVDYVPTKKHIVFGHHFTTIAGLGPIVGPAIGIIWGWLPALIWVFFGAIFMGAFHDFASLVVSGRNNGQTLGDLTRKLINPTTRFAFQAVMQLLLFIILSVFAMIVGVLFKMFPEAVIPVWSQIPIAIWLGWQIKKGKNDLVYSIISVIILYILIWVGVKYPISVPPIMGSEVVTWCVISYIYVFFASTIPVHVLLQPRDYINSHQLFVSIALLILGVFVAHPQITAPAINAAAFKEGTDVPSLMPLLFITIACGAISGFHSLASSGTTVKQVDKEKDMLFIGYGSMVFESFLAVLVLIAIAGGLGIGVEENGVMFKGVEAFKHRYGSWQSASGLEAKLGAFIIGGSNLLKSFGIPLAYGKALITVFIVSFANTTLDSTARIQRLSFQEIFKTSEGKILKPFDNRYFSTFIVVAAACFMAFAKPGAKGALMLWPLFGSLNQLLAALALGIISIYLYRNKINPLYAVLPMIFILFVTVWAMFNNLIMFINKNDIVLIVISSLILALTAWLLFGMIGSVFKGKNLREI